MTRGVEYDNALGQYAKKVPAGYKSVNKKTFVYVEELIKLGGVDKGTHYGYYSENMQAKYGKLVHNKNTGAAAQKLGSGTGWLTNFWNGTLYNTLEKEKERVAEYMEIMWDAGVIDML